MSDSVRLYLSAAPDLEPEREMLAKAVVEIPTSLGWRIGQTPKGDLEADLDAVAQADLHVLILGSDVRAPVGLEWRTARRFGQVPALFEKDIPRTQAADGFRRELARSAEWHLFSHMQDLRRQVLRRVVGLLLQRSADYQLEPAELARLEAWQKNLGKIAKKGQPQPSTGTAGADAGAVILSTERFIPSEGKLIAAKR